MNRLALLPLLLTVACGGANFTGTFDVVGSATWQYTGSDGASYRLDFEPQDPATIAESPNAEYDLTVDGCTLVLTQISGDAADIKAGQRCSYPVDGTVITEVYRTGVVKVIDDRITVRGSGDLHLRTTGGDQKIGTVSLDYTLYRSSEWVEQTRTADRTARTTDRTADADRTERTRTAEAN